MSGPGAPGRTPWPATPLIALASFLGVFALSTMIVLGGWLRTTGAVLLVVTLAVVATRLWTRSRLLPTLVGAAVTVLVMVPVFALDDEGQRRYLPTPGALADLWEALQGGVTHAATTVAPAEATRPFIALITAAMVALFLVAEHLAVSWRAVASAGVLLLIPWMPAVIFQHRVSVLALLAAITCWIGAMALTRRAPAHHRAPSLGAAVTATAATVAIAAIVVPSALGGNGWGLIPRFQTPESLDTATRLNLALDLRNSLTTNSQSPVMVYVTTGGKPDTLRLYTLTDFDGSAWSQRDPVITQHPASAGVLWPEAVEDWTQRERQRIDVQIATLTERNLPLPSAPRTVTVPDGWFYNPERDEVVTDGAGTRDLAYSIVTDLDYHTEETLRAVEPLIATDDLADPQYLEVPPAVDLANIRAIAQDVTADAPTRYDQAMALQSYFRNQQEFTYDTTVAPSGGDSVSAFLETKAGYCVQFSTAMVMMARSLDIPARLAVGFLSGRNAGEGSYVVRGGDAHAWPELYFPGHGWVRFEPTPAVQTGLPPRWADPYAGQVPVPQDVLDGAAGVPAPDVPDTGPGMPATPGADQDAAPALPVWAMVAGGAALVVLIAAVLWWRRRGRGHVRADGVEAVWEELRRRLGDDLAWAPSLTPHEAAEHVEDGMRRLGAGLTGAARESLTRLSNAVSDHRYAPEGSAVDTTALHAWADQVAAEASEALAGDDATGRPARVGARSAPRRDA